MGCGQRFIAALIGISASQWGFRPRFRDRLVFSPLPFNGSKRKGRRDAQHKPALAGFSCKWGCSNTDRDPCGVGDPDQCCCDPQVCGYPSVHPTPELPWCPTSAARASPGLSTPAGCPALPARTLQGRCTKRIRSLLFRGQPQPQAVPIASGGSDGGKENLERNWHAREVRGCRWEERRRSCGRPSSAARGAQVPARGRRV